MQNDNNCQMDNILLAKFEPSALPVSGQEPSAVQPTHESCDESEDDEWKYTKEGQGEKQLGLQGDTVVEEELPQELQDAGVTFSINERKASGNILQQQISINTSNLIESINDTFEGLTQNITELADQAAAAAVTDNKEETLEQGIQNLNLSQSSTREKLDNIEDDEELSASEMNSRLNPEAKEFVPTFSPPASSATENGFGNGNNPATAIPHHFKDELISQSPRKGRESNMEDIKIPAENEFEEEIAHKPHELTGDEAITEPTENGGTELFQEMNWKEAMHGSEKEEGPLVDSPVTEESLEVVDNQMQYASAAPPNVCELSAPVDLDNAGMKESIYIENNTSNDDLNSVQILPVDDIEIEQDAPEMKDNDVISKEEVQEILTLASDEKIETRIEEEIEQKMENLLLSHDKEFTKDINQMEADQIPINGVEMPSEEPAAIQMEEQIIAVSEPIVEQKPQEPSAPTAEESAPSPVPVAEEALEGLGLGAAAAVVAATAVATVAATTAATTKSAVKKVEDEKNQKNLKKTSSATKSKVPDTKKPAVGSAAAKTSTVSSVSAAAKRTLADKPKPTAAASSLAAKKAVSSTVSAAAPRPRAAAPTASAGVKSAIEKKTTTSTTSTVKSRIDAKAPTTLATRKPLSSSATKTTTSSKPGDETKSSSSTVKSSTIGKSTLGSKPSVGSTRTSATNLITKPRPATASSAATTNGIATKTASAAKPTTLAPKSAGAAKPSTTSPRGTLTSTLRKTEAVKSPTKTTSSTITSRVSTNGVTKSTTTTRTTTTKTTPSSTVPTTTRTTTSRLSVTGTTTGSTTPTSKTTTNNILASRKSTPLKKTTTNSSTTPTARKSIGSKLNSSATKPTTKDSSTPRPVTIPAQHQQQNSIQKNAAAEESKNAAAAAAIAAVIEEPKLNGNASPDDVLLPSITEAAQVAAPISHPLIEMETV